MPPKLRTSTPASTVSERSAATVPPERRDRVGDPGTIDVDGHPQPMGGLAHRRDLVRRVERAELGALRQRDHAGLGVVGDTDQVGELVELLRADLAVVARQIDQLGAEDPLRGAGLVDRDVRPVRTHDRLRRFQHRRQGEHVGAGAREREKRLGGGAEEVAETRLALCGVGISAVRHHVPDVGRGDRVDHTRMGAREVVAGERTVRGRWQVHAPSMSTPPDVEGQRATVSPRWRSPSASGQPATN